MCIVSEQPGQDASSSNRFLERKDLFMKSKGILTPGVPDSIANTNYILLTKVKSKATAAIKKPTPNGTLEQHHQLGRSSARQSGCIKSSARADQA